METYDGPGKDKTLYLFLQPVNGAKSGLPDDAVCKYLYFLRVSLIAFSVETLYVKKQLFLLFYIKELNMFDPKSVKDELNSRLKNHPQYEPWMRFIAIKEEDSICTPVVQNPGAGETELQDADWRALYEQVTRQVQLG